ncbi:hypothetical protein AB0K51_07060 [Kitasatospora sp. NPDC049285]|uniref:hypothetical protein n=1 Tax=Kitasatospora sp. NPDC049285 TaxID=3157096 RepID=UPI003437E4DE
MCIPRSRTLGPAAALAALALGGAAVPARAADPAPTLTAPAAVAVDPAATSVDHGSGFTTVDLKLTLPGTTHPTRAVFRVDLTPLAGVASVRTPDGCTLAMQVLTCGQHWLVDGTSTQQLALYAPAGGGTAGATAVLHVTAAAGSGTTASDTKVTLGGSRLAFTAVPTGTGLRPGDSWTPDLTLTNKGQLPASRLYFTFTGGMDLTFAPRFSNCEYGTDGDGGQVVICTVGSTVAPGESVHLDPIALHVDTTAYTAYEDVAVDTTAPDRTGPLSRYHFTPGPAGSPRLTVGKPETPTAPGGALDLHRGNGTGLTAQVANSADFAAFGAWAPDTAKRQGKLSVGMTSSGPAAIRWRGGGEPAHVRVELPKTARVVAAPDACRLADPAPSASLDRYDCATGSVIPSGYFVLFDFTVEADPAAGGSAVVTLPSIGQDGRDGGKPWDPDKANDTATVALDGRTSGATPTGAASPPGTAAAHSPTATAPSSAAPTTRATTPSGTVPGSDLASTGATGIAPMLAGGLGAVAVGSGVILFLTQRRRRGAHRGARHR